MCNSDPSFPGVDDDRLLAALTQLAPPGSCWACTPRATRCSRRGSRGWRPRAARSPAAASRGRPIVEVEAVSRAIVLAEAARRWIHIVHLSCGAAADAVARAKARGVRVTCETVPAVPRARPRRPRPAGAVRALRAADPLPGRRGAPVGAPRRRHDRLHHDRPLRVHVREPHPRRRRHLRGAERPARHRNVRAGASSRRPASAGSAGTRSPAGRRPRRRRSGSSRRARAPSRSGPTPTWPWSTRPGPGRSGAPTCTTPTSGRRSRAAR